MRTKAGTMDTYSGHELIDRNREQTVYDVAFQYIISVSRLLAKESVLPLMHDLGISDHKDEIMELFAEQVVDHISRGTSSRTNKSTIAESICVLNLAMLVAQDTDKDDHINISEFIHLYNEVTSANLQCNCSVFLQPITSLARCVDRARGSAIGTSGLHPPYVSLYVRSQRPEYEC